MEKKHLATPIGIALVVAILAVNMDVNPSVSIVEELSINDAVMYSMTPLTPITDHHSVLGHGSDVDVFVKRYGSDWEPWDSNTNLITSAGLNLVRSVLGQGEGAHINHLALGNTTAPVAGSTTHPGLISSLGLTSADGTFYEESQNGNWTIGHTWTATGTILVNTTGLYNDTNSGTYFAGTTFTAVTLNNNDQLSVNYTSWVA